MRFSANTGARIVRLWLALFWTAQLYAIEILPVYTTRMGLYSNVADSRRPGLFIDLLGEIARISGLKTEIVDLPWQRALSPLHSGFAPGVIVPLTRSEERERNYLWIVNVVKEWRVFWGKSNLPELHSIEQLRQRKIGVIRGTPFEAELRKLKFPKIDIAKDAVTNAKKLEKGRIDYWYATTLTVADTFRQLGYKDGTFKKVFTQGSSDLYIGAHLDFSQNTVEKIRKAYKDMEANGTLKTLLEKYRILDLQR